MYQKNSQYRLTTFKASCPDPYMHKLMSMGFVPGALFEIRKVAPLGDPYQIEIKGCFVSMRKSELDFLEVEKL